MNIHILLRVTPRNLEGWETEGHSPSSERFYERYEANATGLDPVDEADTN